LLYRLSDLVLLRLNVLLVDPELRRRRPRLLSKFKFTRLSKLPSRLKRSIE